MTVVNLNRARKAKAKAADAATAKANRVKFGRTAAERTADAADGERLKRSLDQSRRDPSKN